MLYPLTLAILTFDLLGLPPLTYALREGLLVSDVAGVPASFYREAWGCWMMGFVPVVWAGAFFCMALCLSTAFCTVARDLWLDLVWWAHCRGLRLPRRGRSTAVGLSSRVRPAPEPDRAASDYWAGLDQTAERL